METSGNVQIIYKDYPAKAEHEKYLSESKHLTDLILNCKFLSSYYGTVITPFGSVVVFLDKNKDEMFRLVINSSSIKIGDKYYIRKPDRGSSTPFYDKVLSTLSMYGLYRHNPIPIKNSIEDEFLLIKEKKSNLSSSQRHRVVARFESIYQEIEFSDENIINFFTVVPTNFQPSGSN